MPARAVAAASASGAEVLVGDLRDMPFRDAAVRLVLLVVALSSLADEEDVRGALLDVRRVLQPGGHGLVWEPRVPPPGSKLTLRIDAAAVASVLGPPVYERAMTVLPPIARRLAVRRVSGTPLLARVPAVLGHRLSVFAPVADARRGESSRRRACDYYAAGSSSVPKRSRTVRRCCACLRRRPVVPSRTTQRGVRAVHLGTQAECLLASCGPLLSSGRQGGRRVPICHRAVSVSRSSTMVYEARRGSMPRLRPYVRSVWRRRSFIFHVAVSDVRAGHYNTALGPLWLLANPLLLAGIYFVLLTVIVPSQSGGLTYIAVLISGLFAFYYTRNALSLGARSIIGGGPLITNSVFPRAVLPLAALCSSFMLYLPMLAVYAVFHVIAGLPIGQQLLWIVPLLVVQTAFNFGCALGLAAATVLVRDVTSALGYGLRIWLYLSPVLWTVDQPPDHVKPYLMVNPLYSILGTWQRVVVEGRAPDAMMLLLATAWAVLALVAGAAFFLSREHEFALRL